MKTSVERTIDCVAREVAQVLADRNRFEHLTEELERDVTALKKDLSHWRAVAEHWHDEAAKLCRMVHEFQALACLNPSCQLHIYEPD